jgi:hypothetical protein
MQPQGLLSYEAIALVVKDLCMGGPHAFPERYEGSVASVAAAPNPYDEKPREATSRVETPRVHWGWPESIPDVPWP